MNKFQPLGQDLAGANIPSRLYSLSNKAKVGANRRIVIIHILVLFASPPYALSLEGDL
jgi:hypothetical protein